MLVDFSKLSKPIQLCLLIQAVRKPPQPPLFTHRYTRMHNKHVTKADAAASASKQAEHYCTENQSEKRAQQNLNNPSHLPHLEMLTYVRNKYRTKCRIYEKSDYTFPPIKLNCSLIKQSTNRAITRTKTNRAN